MLDKIDADIMILVNTLYFKGDWASQFDPSDTTDARFTLADGQSVYTPTMKQEYDDALYLESDTARGILLPYVDGRYAYAAILPEDDVSAYVQGLTADAFKALLDSASPEKVKLYMPRYEADGSYDLNGILKTMGLEQAFDPDRADFSAMGSAELGNLYIDKVRQDIVFKLGETGTEAAAATSVEMALTALPIGERQIELHLDRPFVYALMDMETMTPLFLGVLENPAE
jgi:serpin B